MKVQEALNEAFEALLPFADCLQYIEIDEDDEEWAKFRLLIKHYRQAAVAYGKCKSALSEIENCEPVAYCNSEQLADMKLKRQSCNVWHQKYDGCDVELCESPISKEWLSLTDEQLEEIIKDWATDKIETHRDYANAISSKLKQLNFTK